MTREAWLTGLVSTLSNFADDLELEAGQKIWGHAKASCGYGGAKSRSRIFDVVPSSETADKIPQIFIAPTIHTTDAAIDAVFAALAALAGGTHKQNAKDFKKALAVLDSMRDFAVSEVKTWDESYPQAALAEKDKNEREGGAQALLKVSCKCPVDNNEKPFVVRMTPKQAERALPICPFCSDIMKLEEKENEVS